MADRTTQIPAREVHELLAAGRRQVTELADELRQRSMTAETATMRSLRDLRVDTDRRLRLIAEEIADLNQSLQRVEEALKTIGVPREDPDE